MVRYSFYITDGPDEGKTFVLDKGTTLIGRRDTKADDDPPQSARWVLTDPAVSRTHARIDWDGELAPVLIHLSSTNATLLEGRIVTGQSIEDGQSLQQGHTLRMGQTGFQVQEEIEESGWFLKEQNGSGSEHPLTSEQALELDGVRFHLSGVAVEVGLAQADSEAYLLRMMENQYWTTVLKHQKPVLLRRDDIIQTSGRKLVLLDR